MEIEGYDVLRLIEHGKICYVSSDYATGKPMINWLRYHPNISKELLFCWMQEIVYQLGCFHRLRGEPCFKYVNPYSIIVTEDRKLFLLDTGADSSQSIIRQMQRRAVRESFLPEEEAFYQKESVALDIYGIGKTFQYLLSVVNPAPDISKKEEIKLKRIISKCLNSHSKKSFHTIRDIQKNFPLLREKKINISRKIIKKIILGATFILLLSGAYMVLQNSKSMTAVKTNNKKSNSTKESDKESPEIPKTTSDIENSEAVELEFKMGMLYLLETEEYEKSKECFKNIQDKVDYAKDYLALAECLSGNQSGNNEDLKQRLSHAEANIPEDYFTECSRALMKGYRLLDSKESAQSIIHLGTGIMERSPEEPGLEDKVEQELNEFMSTAYEKLGETESAVKYYEKQLASESEDKKREALYKKIVLLWEDEGKADAAGEICLKGAEELKDSLELRIIYISLLCRNPSIEREVCAQTIQNYLKEMPELGEQEEFQKLKREYNISMEGEQVWVGE